MKVTIKPKVIKQILGYRVKQLTDGKKYIKKYGVFAGKRIRNNDKGYNTIEEAVDVINQINSGEIKAINLKPKKK